MSRVSTQAPDWTNGPASEHAAHKRDLAMASSGMLDRGEQAPGSVRLSFDQVLEIARQYNLAAPVTVSPPNDKRPTWLVKAEPQNRPLGRTLELDAVTGGIAKDVPFSSKPWIDQVVAMGVHYPLHYPLRLPPTILKIFPVQMQLKFIIVMFPLLLIQTSLYKDELPRMRFLRKSVHLHRT